tara:strand:+ start:7500 stop:8201 length:702 start_codon:yes stop_codon:yes gene_type:complete
MTEQNSHRIGILGGTFDPIHIGHLDAAAAAKQALDLDEILFVPANKPPHRQIHPQASSSHRTTLVELAINEHKDYRISDVELRRETPSYTALTLQSLHSSGWKAEQLFFILGADAFSQITTWHDYPRVLSDSNFVVIERHGITLDPIIKCHPELSARVSSLPCKTNDLNETQIFLVKATTKSVSSTEIRNLLTKGLSIDGLVPEPVAQHIYAYSLYKKVDRLHAKKGKEGKNH